MNRLLKILLILLLLPLAACDSGFQKMGGSEYGVVFTGLPRFLGGGVRERPAQPGEMEFIFPWQTLYRVDTSLQSITWGGVGEGDNQRVEDYVQTRALDGNEVGLAITIQYSIDPEKVTHVVTRVGTTKQRIRNLITSVARADIRTHMNVLATRSFFDPKERDDAVNKVRDALNIRLKPEGIIFDDVIYKDHRFERRLANGTYDRSYQEQIDKTQALDQQRQREEKKVAAVVAKKKADFNDAQAEVNRMLEKVDGERQQAIYRGDAYLTAKQNKAKEVTAVGEAEVEGLKKKIASLSGPGGEALLRLSLAKELIASDPKFVLLNSSDGSKGGLDLSRVDTNELIRQAGIFSAAHEVLQEPKPRAAAKAQTPARSRLKNSDKAAGN